MSLRAWLGRKIGLTDSKFWAAFSGRESYSGKFVTADAALQLATVWACVRLTAQAVSMLPLQLFERTSGGRMPAASHPIADIIADSPNDEMTGLEFWEAVTAWLCVNGNSYAEKSFIGDRLVSLNLIPADQMQVTRNTDGDLVFRFNDRGLPEQLPADKIFHVKGFGFGGDLGLSPIRFGVQTFGSAIATDETAGKIFDGGMMPAGVLTADQAIDDVQRESLTKIMQAYAGSKNAGKMMVLEAGLKYQQLSLDPETTQMLETRRFHVEEICRWFGTPPIIVGHAAQGQTMWGTGVEALLIQWLTTGLNPYLSRIERRIRKQLLTPEERSRFYAEFNREGLLQADSAAKASFLSTMVQNGLMGRIEARSKLNLPAIPPNGDRLTVQTNLTFLDQLGAAAAPAARTEPKP